MEDINTSLLKTKISEGNILKKFTLELDEDNFALHKAVVNRNTKLIESLVQDGANIDERDWHGNTPLTIACHLRWHKGVDLLISLGADPISKNGGGFSPLQESIASKDVSTAVKLFKHVESSISERYKNRLPQIAEELKKVKCFYFSQQLPDFYMEIKWEFKSWVPLVSRLCPNDTYRIWKMGTSIRVDTTLIGFEYLKWKRGNVSLMLLGGKDDTPFEVILLDHEKKIVQYPNKNKKTVPDDEIIGEIGKMLEKGEVTHVELRTDNVKFSPAKNWWGYDREEEVAGFHSTVYDISGFVWHTLRRKFDEPKGTTEKKGLYEIKDDDGQVEMPPGYFEEGTTDPRGKGFGLLHPHEKLSTKERNFKGTLWLAKEFPHRIEELFPIFELLSPTNKHFAKLQEFVQLQLPDAGFPIRLEVPVVPTLSGSVTFLQFRAEQPDPEMFVIPSDYNASKIKLNFDFVGKKKEKKEEGTLEDNNGKEEE